MKGGGRGGGRIEGSWEREKRYWRVEEGLRREEGEKGGKGGREGKGKGK